MTLMKGISPMPKLRKSLNILYVGTLPPHPGGSAISCSQLIIGFAKLGHTVRALAPITAEALRSGDVFAASHPEIGVMRFQVPYFETTPYISPSDEYRRLEREQIRKGLLYLIANKRPDIIFIGRETFAWHVPDLARTQSLPCILRIAGNPTLGVLNGAYPEPLAQQLLEQYRKASFIVTPAEHLAEGLRQFGIQNIKTILNAVDLQQFSPTPKDSALLRELALRDDDIIVVHAANLKTVKRPLDVIHSAEKVLQQNPKLVYVIVGDGTLRGTMEDTCRQKNIAENFRFVGWIDYPNVPDYINLADIVVMPSEAEGLARVYLETQACGRFLLASDIPPAREVIVNGETGLLFRKGDINDLTAKTLLAAGNPKLRAEIGRKARERVQVHSIDRATADYVATFEDIIQQHRE